jgi:hypothetical protein
MHANDVLTLSNHDCPITRGNLFLTHGDGHVYFSACKYGSQHKSTQPAAISSECSEFLLADSPRKTFAQAKMAMLVAAAILRYSFVVGYFLICGAKLAGNPQF